ncbi:MAG TPA: patatin-like phospholipase family protein [Stellaceae bacterium]|nr:patatin-like phospholipase family protein [Stellaceae bacterium]
MSGPITWDACLRAEYEKLFKSGDEAELRQVKPTALCLSGGGIRSATFCLGVLQALATTGLLRQFNYLSTVSGGGYIGAWLTASIRHRGSDAVINDLQLRDPDRTSDPPSLEHLRNYSNYLTPRLGLTSGDTLAAVGGIARNLLMTWAVLVPLLWLTAIAPKLVAALGHWATLPGDGVARPAAILAVAVTLGLAVVSLAFTRKYVLCRPPAAATAAEAAATSPAQFQLRFLGVILLPAILAGAGFASIINAAQSLQRFDGAPWLGEAFNLPWLTDAWWHLPLVGVLVALLAWLVIPCRSAASCVAADFLAWLIAGAASGAALWWGAELYVCGELSQVYVVILGVPWFLASLLSGHVAYQFLRSYSRRGDFQREWLAKAGGYFLAVAAGWALLASLVLFGPCLARAAPAWLSSLGGLTGLATALLGKSASTPAMGRSTDWTALALNVALALAGPLFAGILLILLSWMSDALVFDGDFTQSTLFWGPFGNGAATYHKAWMSLLVAIGLPVLIGLAAGFFVNVNRFSLHAIYRNRLIRAYLGAARLVDRPGMAPSVAPADRHPDPFTEFDLCDNIRLQAIAPDKAEGWCPLHVINMALNLSYGEKLSWQQRKATSFTATPYYCGSALPGLGFRPTAAYGDPAGGISLGTAMAISGAAISSNMGYHSSPSVSFLLTLLNVRLGWWLGNPGEAGERHGAMGRSVRRLVSGLARFSANKCVARLLASLSVLDLHYRKDGPWLAIRPYLAELFGLLTDKSAYVYLSDGGHFENLGLYEMVRRRCTLIVVIDAGADPDYAFEDLGNAIRKIRIDLNTDVEIPGLERMTDPGTPQARPTYLIGKIHYPKGATEADTGAILYIKPKAVDDPGDVFAYHLSNSSFPFDTTFDQWFSEPQFESYRALGAEITGDIWRSAGRPGTLADLMTALS